MMGDVVYTVKLKFVPYPWYNLFTALFQVITKGYFEVQGVLTDLGWKTKDEAKYTRAPNP